MAVGKYELRARAERMAETRRRIVEATVRLHTTIGPAATTISGIAEAAGVQRHTVYSHFPDERTLFAACSGFHFARHPYPDPERWRRIDDPRSRATTALQELYAHYRSDKADIWPVIRDLPRLPEFAGRTLVAYLESARAALIEGRRLRGVRAARVRALIGLALRFETWRQLTQDGGLSDEVAAQMMADAIECAAAR